MKIGRFLNDIGTKWKICLWFSNTAIIFACKYFDEIHNFTLFNIP